MPAPTRAIHIIPIGERPEVADLSAEMVAAYKAVKETQTIIIERRQGSSGTMPRNAALEAAGRFYAEINFR